MQTLELLAPAKNLECGMAAIDHGADAVYIGADRFGARAAAGNSISDIRQLCHYAHLFSAKVYVTVNTIVYDSELADTQRLICQLADMGVDAIIVQDMAVLQMRNDGVFKFLPALHASTQTDNRTAEKVRWLHGEGFSRVVLARELSVDDIADIHRQVPDVELEVFVHGALCVSYSGLCYASQYCFRRSANRGECAQFCRMKFDLLDAEGRELEHQRHLLSLKDMNRLYHLEELAAAGVCSFKIEGRLKDVGYVKNVVSAYSQQLDLLIAKYPDRYCRASRGHVTYHFTPQLQKTFNRGYTTYYLHGRQPDVFSPDTPKAMGEYVGVVKELRRDSFTVSGTAAFANGDGLCFFNRQHELEGFRVNRADGNRLSPQVMPSSLCPGLALYRNNDQEFERILSRVTAVRKLQVTMQLRAISEGFSLSADGITVTIPCEHQQAEKPQRDNIVRQLCKLGGTVYECSGVDIPAGFGYFIPSSVLGEMRRKLVEQLDSRNNHSEKHSNMEAPDVKQINTAGGTDAVTDLSHVTDYDANFLYNIANHSAARFYGVPAPTAYELKGGEGPLMQCRHCLRYAMGCCARHGGRQPQWREPLKLRLGDGRQFRLEFDCRNCQMNVYADDAAKGNVEDKRRNRHSFSHMLILLCSLLLMACYNHGQRTPDAWDLTKQQIDSISFSTTHHYTQNYNFVVNAQSLPLSDAIGEQAFDTMYITKGQTVVVAEIENVPSDTIDSIWVKVARDQITQGWIRESELLQGVSPDDPISQFIDIFSNNHLLIFLALAVVVGGLYAMRRLLRHNAYIVHFNDIDSFYPTLLCLLLAASATLYAGIQMFGAESWRHFYYHPSLNPFALPLHLGLFVASVWAVIIVGVAAVDDVFHRLNGSDAWLYLAGLAAVCGMVYVFFSISTLYYIGFPLLIAYAVFALYRYFRVAHFRYTCGHCGRPLRQKGRCPHCGTENV